MPHEKPKSRDEIFRAARDYKGNNLFGENDKENQPYFFKMSTWPATFVLENETSEQMSRLLEGKRQNP